MPDCLTPQQGKQLLIWYGVVYAEYVSLPQNKCLWTSYIWHIRPWFQDFRLNFVQKGKNHEFFLFSMFNQLWFSPAHCKYTTYNCESDRIQKQNLFLTTQAKKNKVMLFCHWPSNIETFMHLNMWSELSSCFLDPSPLCIHRGRWGCQVHNVALCQDCEVVSRPILFDTQKSRTREQNISKHLQRKPLKVLNWGGSFMFRLWSS